MVIDDDDSLMVTYRGTNSTIEFALTGVTWNGLQSSVNTPTLVGANDAMRYKLSDINSANLTSFGHADLLIFRRALQGIYAIVARNNDEYGGTLRMYRWRAAA